MILVIVLSIIGLLVGVVASLLGVGGGFLNVPVLHLIGGVNMKNAVGTSLCVIAFTASSATLSYCRQGKVDLVLGLILEGATMPGAFIGAYLTGIIKSFMLEGVFAAGLIIVGTGMILGVKREVSARISWLHSVHLRRQLEDGEGRVLKYSINLPIAFGGCFIAGMASGFLGIGGGILKVPLLTLLGVPIHIAVATSCFMILLTALVGITEHAMLGHVNTVYALAMGAGAVLGGQVGSRISGKFTARGLRRLFGFFMVCIGIYMFYLAVWG
ncbi:MAG: sulfite exporter TauE/SafE family protein [Candidatus Freyarchaeota archaeon]|nr:sulfite exporter TauE/SafE family protein [Candidatus Bathyarchaeota archaeon]